MKRKRQVTHDGGCHPLQPMTCVTHFSLLGSDLLTHTFAFLQPTSLTSLLWGCCKRLFPLTVRESVLRGLVVMREPRSATGTVAYDLETVARTKLRYEHRLTQIKGVCSAQLLSAKLLYDHMNASYAVTK